MSDLSLTGKTAFKARALLVGERIDLRALEATDRVAGGPATITVRGGGVAVLFRYGAVVLFDTAPLEEASFLTQLQPLVQQPYATPETETVDIRIDAEKPDTMDGDVVILADGSVQRLQIVADILAKSIVLARNEAAVKEHFDRIEPLAVELQQSGRAGRSGREVLKSIGNALLSEHNMVGRVEVTDKPDLLWERTDLERLFTRLEQAFEIRDRHLALERKLDLIARTAQTVLDLVQNQHALRVEWYIVALIVFEIVLSLYEKYMAH